MMVASQKCTSPSGFSVYSTAPFSDPRTVGPWEPTAHRHDLEKKEHVLWLTGFWEMLSVVFHSQTSFGLCGRTSHASGHMWHSRLDCKIYPAWQLVKELCNSHQLTETTVRRFQE